MFGERVGFVVHTQARKEERTGTGKQAAQELGAWEWLWRNGGKKAVAGKCGEDWGRNKREKRLCWWGQQGGLAPCVTLLGFCREALTLLDS